jgi:hypothetical protein
VTNEIGWRERPQRVFHHRNREFIRGGQCHADAAEAAGGWHRRGAAAGRGTVLDPAPA